MFNVFNYILCVHVLGGILSQREFRLQRQTKSLNLRKADVRYIVRLFWSQYVIFPCRAHLCLSADVYSSFRGTLGTEEMAQQIWTQNCSCGGQVWFLAPGLGGSQAATWIWCHLLDPRASLHTFTCPDPDTHKHTTTKKTYSSDSVKKKTILYDVGTVFLSGLSYIPCVLVVKGQYVSVKYASLHISVRGFLIQQLALCILFQTVQFPFNLRKYDWQIGTYLRCTMWYFYTRFATVSTIKLVSISMTPYAHIVL